MSALELQEINTDPVVPVRYLGAASDYQAQVALGKGLADTTVYFGVATKADWSVPLAAPVDILIDSNRDGTNDYELTVDESGAGQRPVRRFALQGQHRRLPLRAGEWGAGRGARHRALQHRRAGAAGAGLVAEPSERCEQVQLLLERDRHAPVHTFDVAHPGLVFGGTDYLGAAAAQPLYQDLDGQTIQVTFTQADYTANAALGVLLLHHHNAAGSRAQVLRPLVRVPRKQLKR